MIPKNEHKIEEGSLQGRQVLWKALDRLSMRWKINSVSIAQILGNDRTRISAWKEDGAVPKKMGRFTREALQHFFAINKSLYAIFQDTNDQVLWLNTFHPGLNQKPLELMKSSMTGLITVRTYLDYARGKGA